MTRRDFELIARTVRALRDMPAIRGGDADLVASTFADVLKEMHPRFDRARFLEACGVRLRERVAA